VIAAAGHPAVTPVPGGWAAGNGGTWVKTASGLGKNEAFHVKAISKNFMHNLELQDGF
jgi:hypothetical protein